MNIFKNLLVCFTTPPDIPRNLEIQGIEFWDKFIPLSYAQAVEILTCDLPPETDIRITLEKDGHGSIRMIANGVFEESWGHTSRPFNLFAGTLGAGDLRVRKEHQGSGVGRKVLRNEMEFFYQCGVKRFNIHATLDAGGYSWAREGFLPDTVDDSNFKYNTKDPVQMRYAAIRPYLDTEETRILDAAIQFKTPQDIWRIASQGALNRKLRSLFQAKAGRDKALMNNQETAFQEAFAKGAKGTWGKKALDNIQASVDAGKPVTIGQVLLAGTEWCGHLDMTDKEQMKRVGDYVGGWRYIAPSPRS